MGLGCCCNNVPVYSRVAASKIWQGWKAFDICDHCDVETTRYRTITVEYGVFIDGSYTPIGADPDDYNASISMTVDRESGIVTLGECSGPETQVDFVATFPCSDGIDLPGYFSLVDRTSSLCVEIDPCELSPWTNEGWEASTTTATSLVLRKEFIGPTTECPLTPHGYHQYTLTLSDPYTYEDLQDDVDALLGEVLLVDSNATGKYVSRNEAYSVYTGWQLQPSGSPLVCEILGHQDFEEVCDFVDPRTNDGAISTVSNPGGPILEQCGAWYQYNDALYGQKWMELKISAPAHNWFRPARWDRFIPDDSSGVYATEIDNTVPTAPVFTVAAHGFVVTDKVLVYFGAHDRSLWEVTAQTATTITLGNKHELDQTLFDYAKAQLPTIDSCTSTVALLAPQLYSSAWPILGRVGVTSATQNGGDVDLVVDADTALDVGDSVTFSGVGSLTTHTVTAVTNKTEFTISATVGSYTSGGYAASTSAPSYSWNSVASTGDFTLREFESFFTPEWVDDGSSGLAAVEVVTGATIFRQVGAAALVPLCLVEGRDIWVCGCPSEATTINRVEFFSDSPDSYWEVEVDGEYPDAELLTVAEPTQTQESGTTGEQLAISPNAGDLVIGEGQLFDMPTTPPATYWTQSHYRQVVQFMRDPVWRKPTLFCTGKNCNIEDWLDTQPYYPPMCAEDDTDLDAGLCINYRVFPLAPLEESVITLPGGAPDLPPGSNLALPCVDFLPCGLLNPHIVNPKRNTCINNDGRFADSYDYNL